MPVMSLSPMPDSGLVHSELPIHLVIVSGIVRDTANCPSSLLNTKLGLSYGNTCLSITVLFALQCIIIKWKSKHFPYKNLSNVISSYILKPVLNYLGNTIQVFLFCSFSFFFYVLSPLHTTCYDVGTFQRGFIKVQTCAVTSEWYLLQPKATW